MSTHHTLTEQASGVVVQSKTVHSFKVALKMGVGVWIAVGKLHEEIHT